MKGSRTGKERKPRKAAAAGTVHGPDPEVAPPRNSELRELVQPGLGSAIYMVAPSVLAASCRSVVGPMLQMSSQGLGELQGPSMGSECRLRAEPVLRRTGEAVAC